MLSQYNFSASIPSSQLNILLSKVGLFDEWIAMQTAQYSYQIVIKNTITDNIRSYKIERQTNGTNTQYWVITEVSVTDFTYIYGNELGVYSNIGVGNYVSLPQSNDIQTYCFSFITVFLILYVAFHAAFKAVKKWLKI